MTHTTQEAEGRTIAHKAALELNQLYGLHLTAAAEEIVQRAINSSVSVIEKALEPFAKYAEREEELWDDLCLRETMAAPTDSLAPSIKDYRRARAALNGEK